MQEPEALAAANRIEALQAKLRKNAVYQVEHFTSFTAFLASGCKETRSLISMLGCCSTDGTCTLSIHGHFKNVSQALTCQAISGCVGAGSSATFPAHSMRWTNVRLCSQAKCNAEDADVVPFCDASETAYCPKHETFESHGCECDLQQSTLPVYSLSIISECVCRQRGTRRRWWMWRSRQCWRHRRQRCDIGSQSPTWPSSGPSPRTGDIATWGIQKRCKAARIPPTLSMLVSNCRHAVCRPMAIRLCNLPTLWQ